jgi:hypothetical protein
MGNSGGRRPGVNHNILTCVGPISVLEVAHMARGKKVRARCSFTIMAVWRSCGETKEEEWSVKFVRGRMLF